MVTALPSSRQWEIQRSLAAWERLDEHARAALVQTAELLARE